MFRSQRRRARRGRVERLERRIALRATACAPPAIVAGTAAMPPASAGTELTFPDLYAHPVADDLNYIHDTLGLRGDGQTVAIVDSGIAYDHPALGGGLGAEYRVVGGWDFTPENDSDPYDDLPAGYHGTHVAGIVGADDVDFGGLAPAVDLVALRVFDDHGHSDFAWVEQALQWVVANRDTFEHPITAVNLSMGIDWNGQSVPAWSTLEDEFELLRSLGISVVAAAGNEFASDDPVGLNYPAASPFVTPVASVDTDGHLSDFSQRVPDVLAAWGEEITSTVPDYLYDFNGQTDDFASSRGTSMAAPYFTGAAVLVREALGRVGRSFSPDEIEQHLRDTADWRLDELSGVRYAQVNLRRALDAILAPASQVAVRPAGKDEIAGGELSETTPVEIDGRDVTITGTSTADRVAIDLMARIIAFGEERWPLPPDAQIDLVNWTRNDVVDIVATPGRDVFSISHDQLTWQGEHDRLALSHFHDIDLADRGGWDTVTLEGGPEDERLTMQEGSAKFYTDRQTWQVEGFETIRAQGNDGNDKVTFLNGVGVDHFFSRSGQSWVDGNGYLNIAGGFEETWAIGDSEDRAQLLGTEGNDHFVAKRDRGWLTSHDHRVMYEGYGLVMTRAELGGYDTARLEGSGMAESFLSKGNRVSMSSELGSVYVDRFARVDVSGNGGHDIARFEAANVTEYGAKSEQFHSKPEIAWVLSGDQLHTVRNVQTVIVEFPNNTTHSAVIYVDQRTVMRRETNRLSIAYPTLDVEVIGLIPDVILADA